MWSCKQEVELCLYRKCIKQSIISNNSVQLFACYSKFQVTYDTMGILIYSNCDPMFSDFYSNKVSQLPWNFPWNRFYLSCFNFTLNSESNKLLHSYTLYAYLKKKKKRKTLILFWLVRSKFIYLLHILCVFFPVLAWSRWLKWKFTDYLMCKYNWSGLWYVFCLPGIALMTVV